MEQNKKLSLKTEIEREASEIEQEITNNPALEDVKVTDEMDAALLARIQSFEMKRAKNRKAESGSGKNTSQEFSREHAADMPNFSGRTNDDSFVHLSEEDKEALRIGREMLKKKNEGDGLFEVNTNYHKHLNSGNHGKEDRTSTGEKAKVFRMPKKKRVIVALVAVCALVVGTGVTSVGSKSYWKELLDGFLGNQSRQTINVKDMETKETEDGEELSAYKETREKLGFLPVRLGYRPEQMELQEVKVDEEQRRALLFFDYEGQMIRYAIYENSSDSSLGQKKEDILIDTFKVKSLELEIEVKEYEVSEHSNNRYVVDFSYNDVYYQLKGIMEKEEIIKIIEDLKFFK